MIRSHIFDDQICMFDVSFPRLIHWFLDQPSCRHRRRPNSAATWKKTLGNGEAPFFCVGGSFPNILNPQLSGAKSPTMKICEAMLGRWVYLFALFQSTGSHVLIQETAKSNDCLGRERYLYVFLDDVGSLGSRLHVKPCWVWISGSCCLSLVLAAMKDRIPSPRKLVPPMVMGNAWKYPRALRPFFAEINPHASCIRYICWFACTGSTLRISGYKVIRFQKVYKFMI